MPKKIEGYNLTGDEKCVLCGTSNIAHREFEYAVCSDDGDFICQKCLYRSGKVWKYSITPHPNSGDHAYMVTDDLDEIKLWLETDESDGGESTMIVKWDFETVEQFIDRKQDEKE